ncbi:MAG: N-formylglutamate amidohydrolase [Planctomycetes bacterium]|nr:N-formylglutamate amidohydrolase [Planctomycetota bacterium]
MKTTGSRAFESLPHVVEFTEFRGSRASAPTVLLEVPHGATRASHFDEVRAKLAGDYPADLRDFFFVNTDVGAPELANAIAALHVEADAGAWCVVARCLVPRTFVDCNRVIEVAQRPYADGGERPSRGGGVTPGLHVYVTDEGDRALLLERYQSYVRSIEAAYEAVVPHGGRALMVHSYAPRSLDVPVDERIVERLRAEYEPSRIEHWPLRPDIDVIADDPSGTRIAAPELVKALVTAGDALEFDVGISRTYALHEGTLAASLGRRYVGKTLCFEVRRDHLVGTFTPFSEMEADPSRVDRIARAIVSAL